MDPRLLLIPATALGIWLVNAWQDGSFKIKVANHWKMRVRDGYIIFGGAQWGRMNHYNLVKYNFWIEVDLFNIGLCVKVGKPKKYYGMDWGD